MDLFISKKNRPNPQIGDDLADQVDSLSAWYFYWLNEPKAHAETFRCLNRIKNIADVSLGGGDYLSGKEEKKACELLHSVQNLPRDELPGRLRQVLLQLTKDNLGAKIVDQMTELQQKAVISKETTEEILTQIHPKLTETKARAIIVYLAKVIENPLLINEALPQVRAWLKEAS